MLMLKPWKCRKCGTIIRNSLEDINAEFTKHTEFRNNMPLETYFEVIEK